MVPLGATRALFILRSCCFFFIILPCLFCNPPPTAILHLVCSNGPDIFPQDGGKVKKGKKREEEEEEGEGEGDWLIIHWHVSFCMRVPERQKQNTWKFLADFSTPWRETHWSAAPPISCLNRHEYFNCTLHFFKTPTFSEKLGCLQGNFPRSIMSNGSPKHPHHKPWVVPIKKEHTTLRFQIHLFVWMVWNYHHNSSHYFVSVNGCLAWPANIQRQARGVMNVVRRAIHSCSPGQPREWMGRWWGMILPFL